MRNWTMWTYFRDYFPIKVGDFARSLSAIASLNIHSRTDKEDDVEQLKPAYICLKILSAENLVLFHQFIDLPLVRCFDVDKLVRAGLLDPLSAASCFL